MKKLEERFWEKVKKTDGCWLWIGATTRGYGVIRVKGKNKYAHRIAWELLNGVVSGSMDVLHSCDNPPCVRPEHLFLGTMKENMQDKVRKGRCRLPVGEQHWCAKLKVADVIEIKEEFRCYRRGVCVELARRYDVGEQTIRDIRKGRCWKEVVYKEPWN